MPEPAAWHCRLAAGWLSLGRIIDAASLTFTLLAMAALLWLETSPAIHLALMIGVLAGLAEKFFALRVAFDRHVFSDWAQRWEAADPASPANDLAAFDACLATAGLRSINREEPRPLDDRIRGALSLLKRQAALFALQSAALVAAILFRSPPWPLNS